MWEVRVDSRGRVLAIKLIGWQVEMQTNFIVMLKVYCTDALAVRALPHSRPISITKKRQGKVQVRRGGGLILAPDRAIRLSPKSSFKSHQSLLRRSRSHQSRGGHLPRQDL